MLSWLLLALLSCESPPPDAHQVPEAPVARERRVLLLVVVDGLRRDRVGIFGGKATPGLDAFAARSTVFDEARTVSPATTPAIHTILSGRAPEAWSETDHLGAQLAAAGFTTALVSSDPAESAGAGWTSTNVAPATLAELLADARAMVEHEPGDLFVLVHAIDLGIGDVGAHPDRDAVTARYDAAVATVDGALGTLAEGYGPKDVVVIVADHGTELGDHGGYGHGNALYEELVHVPLLVRARGMAPGRRGDAVSLLDVAPTIRALAGAPAKPSAGRSLLLLGAPRIVGFGYLDRGTPAFGSWSSGEKWVVRDGKAVRFDLRADPTETHPIPTPESETERRRGLVAQALGVPPSSRFATDETPR